MPARLLKGKDVVQRLRSELKAKHQTLQAQGIQARIVSVVIKGDEASAFYIRNQAKQAAKIELAYEVNELSESTTPTELEEKLRSLNQDKSVSGIILQVPLPQGFDQVFFQSLISPEKDIEGVHNDNLGALLQGGDLLVPCTARAALEMLLHYEIPLEGARVALLSRSTIIGKPLALMLLDRAATLTVCHSRTSPQDLVEITRHSDIVITAVGRKPGFIRGDMLKPGACVVDIATIATDDGSITGDADYDSVYPIAGALTPVPGGVGPVTVMFLLRNALIAAEQQVS